MLPSVGGVGCAAAVLHGLTRGAASRSGSAGASRKSFDVMQAVSGRGREKQPRTADQQFLDKYARENTSRLREEGSLSHQQAFGLAMKEGSKVIATNRSVEGASMRTGPVSGDQSPPAADMERMPSEGEGSDSDAAPQRQRSRSPSFNITSERWRQDHPGYQEIQPRVQRKRSRCCNECLVNCATQCAHLIDDLQAFLTCPLNSDPSLTAQLRKVSDLHAC